MPRLGNKTLNYTYRKTTMRGEKPLFLIMGESGSGKDTLVDGACKELGLTKVVSYTTRPPRSEDEATHKFITLDEFNDLRRRRRLAAVSGFDGFMYGASYEDVAEADFYIIDPSGAQGFRYDRMKRFVELIYITAEEEVRRERMLQRGDGEEQTEQRIQHDRAAFDAAHYPIILASDVFDTSSARRSIDSYLNDFVEKITTAQRRAVT